MPQFRNGSLHLGRFLGVNVFIHWSWFIVAFLFVSNGAIALVGLIGLFAIVLLHEYGHALACRSVGGRANTIVLWPLGGIAFVQPPDRPGAVLWSIAAGPLVNVALLPILGGLLLVVGVPERIADMNVVQAFIGQLFAVNLLLLLFNMLPFYPLDGGQILQAILWFFIGRARSLRIVALIGLAAAGAAIVGVLFFDLASVLGLSPIWTILLALFIGWQAWRGKMAAEYLARQEEVVQPWERGWKM